MLQIIRERAQGIIAWAIVLLLIVPFALWGVNEYFRGDSDVLVAKVEDRGIPVQEFQSLFQRERALRQQMLGKDADSSLLNDALIKRDTLDRMINSEVLAYSAVRAGFRVGDRQLGQEIRNIREFQRDGHFAPEMYESLLRGVGMSKSRFENDLRRDLLADQFLAGITKSDVVTPYEIKMAAKLKGQQRRIGYFVMQNAELASHIEISDQELERYYDNNRDRFSIPEQVTIEYLELSKDQFKSQIEPQEDQIRKMYEDRKAQFMVGEERRARHILIAVDSGGGEDGDGQALRKAQKLLERIRAGESFEDLARTESDDSGSAQDGGDLGFFSKGVMVKPFEDAVYAMQIGQVSEPVKSPFGYHLIKLEEIKKGSQKSFSEVRSQLLGEYLDYKAEEMFFDQAEILTDSTYEIPDSLEPTAVQLGLEIKTAGPFSRTGGQGIAADASIRQAAFSFDVYETGNNSEPVQLGADRLVVLRVKEKQPRTYRPLAEVRESIAQAIRRDSAQRQLEENGETLLERLRAGEDPLELTREIGVGWQTPGFITRDNRNLDHDIVTLAFKMGRPMPNQTLNDGVTLKNGDFAIVTLYEVRDGDFAKLEQQDGLDEFGKAVSRARTQKWGVGLVNALKTQTDVVVYEANLD